MKGRKAKFSRTVTRSTTKVQQKKKELIRKQIKQDVWLQRSSYKAHLRRPNATFNDLPAELHSNIAAYLDVDEVKAMRLLNSKYYQIYQQNIGQRCKLVLKAYAKESNVESIAGQWSIVDASIENLSTLVGVTGLRHLIIRSYHHNNSFFFNDSDMLHLLDTNRQTLETIHFRGIKLNAEFVPKDNFPLLRVLKFCFCIVCEENFAERFKTTTPVHVTFSEANRLCTFVGNKPSKCIYSLIMLDKRC